MSGDDVDHSVRRQTPYTPTNNEIEKCLANVQFNSFLSIQQTPFALVAHFLGAQIGIETK